ncbi:hypothetical protein CERSUDRAFT_85296 [Gelatoporia subvermispora B]|uniref:DUF6533 domain-containing protein n=1 Tax=Ceriporiopsis subvermispora (strain B) TaxID=914234 RepID=M2QTA8_CERS8|nr:hypothetical protein CERSUDRAFT_85296 [Gelatoporia subvermispora B]
MVLVVQSRDSADYLYVMQNSWIESCLTVAGIALVFYDHIMTISHEMEFIWNRKLSCVTLLFHLTRWASFVWAILQVASLIATASTFTCVQLEILKRVISVLLEINWAVFSAIRIFSITGGSWFLAWNILCLSIVPIGIDSFFWFFSLKYGFSFVPGHGQRCTEVNVTGATLPRIGVPTRVCVTIADAMIILVTWVKLYTIKKDADESRVDVPVVKVLLRDGDVLLILNILTIVGDNYLAITYAIPRFTTPINSVILLQFLLNLRQAAYGGQDACATTSLPVDHLQSSSHALASFIGNIGGELEWIAESHDPDVSWCEDVITGGYRETEDLEV